MSQAKQQLKFEKNPCNGFRDLLMPQTDGRTNFEFMSSADIIKHS